MREEMLTTAQPMSTPELLQRVQRLHVLMSELHNCQIDIISKLSEIDGGKVNDMIAPLVIRYDEEVVGDIMHSINLVVDKLIDFRDRDINILSLLNTLV